LSTRDSNFDYYIIERDIYILIYPFREGRTGNSHGNDAYHIRSNCLIWQYRILHFPQTMSEAAQEARLHEDSEAETKYQLRPISLRPSVLSRADGSCQVIAGKTALQLAVYGPKATSRQREKIDSAYFSTIFVPESGGAINFRFSAYQNFLNNTMQTVVLASLFPRTEVELIVQVLQDDGSLLSHSINGATLALIDAGIPMTSPVVAVSCILTKEKELMLDPTQEQEKASAAVMVFAYNSSKEIIAEWVDVKIVGALDERYYWESKKVCISAAGKLLNLIRVSQEKIYAH